MSAKQLLSVVLAALLVSAGAGAAAAASGTGSTNTQASANVTVDATYDNGTVTVTVSQNGSAVSNASVYANGQKVGTTGANGTVTFQTNASEELEIKVVGDDFEVERTYVIENGSLVQEDSQETSGNETETENETRKGPNENASKTAHGVFAIIQQWIDGGREGNLGQMIQEKLDQGQSEEKKPEHAKNASERQGKPDDAGKSGEKGANASAENGKPDDAGKSGENGSSDAGASASGSASASSETETESDSETETDSDTSASGSVSVGADA